MLKKAERASQGYHGRKDVNRYDRPKKLQATSHLWVRMHMQPGFQVVPHVPFSFPVVVQQFVF